VFLMPPMTQADIRRWVAISEAGPGFPG
jgi:hypothetical protein